MKHQLHILRLTLKAKSPISLGSGEEVVLEIPAQDDKKKNEPTHVMALMRDANGLPTFPGASAQGVLRRLYENANGEEDTKRVFGFEGSSSNGLKANGQTGRISFSWAAVHDSHDDAVTGLRDVRGTNDPVLKLLLKDAPLRRDHVALNAQHSVDGRKKFARTAVPIGTRFSLELTAWGNAGTRKALLDAARYFRHPQFRLGGATMRGYGRVEVVRAFYQAPDLNDPIALRELRCLPLSEPLNSDVLKDPDFEAPESNATQAILTLTFTNDVRIGGATPAPGTDKKDAFKTLWALREAQIDYGAGTGTETTCYPLPGSAFKGPLAHRMAYYANKAGSNQLDEAKISELLALSTKNCTAKLMEMGQRPEILWELLGSAKEKPGGQDMGSAAKLTVDDTVMNVSTEQSNAGNIVVHNSIDRFTGGTRDLTGVLFEEEVLSQPTATIELTIGNPNMPVTDGVGGWDKTVADCFLKALHDICNERLPVGARSLGICNGTISWHGTHFEDWQTAFADLCKKAEGQA